MATHISDGSIILSGSSEGLDEFMPDGVNIKQLSWSWSAISFYMLFEVKYNSIIIHNHFPQLSSWWVPSMWGVKFQMYEGRSWRKSKRVNDHKSKCYPVSRYQPSAAFSWKYVVIMIVHWKAFVDFVERSKLHLPQTCRSIKLRDVQRVGARHPSGS